jgi:hypothetical protein
MALMSDAVMVLFCDVASDPAGHDDWHTYEHLHERLSIPGFLRGTRWLRVEGSPRYMMIYEVSGVDMATSPHYLDRLNNPTSWTSATMQRLQGMTRGFCRVAASGGYGLGHAGFVLRFPRPDDAAWAWVAGEVARIASWRGLASVHLFEPATSAPMTKEQSIRGPDAQMSCVLLATAHDAGALRRACDHHLGEGTLRERNIALVDRGFYEMVFTATAAEVARTPANRALQADERSQEGPRLSERGPA